MKKKLHIGLIISLVLILSFLGLAAAVILSEVHFPKSRHMRNGHNNIDRAIMRVYKRRNLENGDKTSEKTSSYAVQPISDTILGIKFEGNYYGEDVRAIENKYVDELLNEKYLFDESTGMTIALYSIKGVSKKVALAAKKAGDETIYIFKNVDYKADNLMEYLQEHGIHKETNINYICLSEPKVRFAIYYCGDSMQSFILNEWLDKGKEKTVKEWDDGIEKTGLSISVSDDSGAIYLTLTILENGDVFAKDSVGCNEVYAFAWDDGISWGVNLIKELSEREKGGLEIYN